MMKTTHRVSFSWNLGKTNLPTCLLPKHYELGTVEADDCQILQNVIRKSLVLDPGWTGVLGKGGTILNDSLARSVAAEPAGCLALRHGARIIGGTFLSTDTDANEHLVPGPCILMEYRNRGLGALLLLATLRYLRDAGLARACAITSESSVAARFLYPKYGGQASSISPSLAA